MGKIFEGLKELLEKIRSKSFVNRVISFLLIEFVGLIIIQESTESGVYSQGYHLRDIKTLEQQFIPYPTFFTWYWTIIFSFAVYGVFFGGNSSSNKEDPNHPNTQDKPTTE